MDDSALYKRVELVCAAVKKNAVDKAITFAKQFVGTPYHNDSKEPTKLKQTPPFYAVDNAAIDIAKIRKQGMNCSGLLNLVHRHMGVPIPDKPFRGGTSAYVEKYGKKIPKKIPRGSLLLRPPPKGDGHVALVVSDNKGLEDSTVIDSDGFKQSGVTVHTVGERTQE